MLPHITSPNSLNHVVLNSRIARGLPMGGEIEYVDSGTLAQAMIERKTIKD